MSGFSRSLRSPSYLTARRRPAMPGRTVSGSSERSMASDDGGEFLMSGPTTPLPAYQRRYASSHQQQQQQQHHHHNHHQVTSHAIADSAPAAPMGAAAARANGQLSSAEYFGNGTRPMAIEIPRVNRTGSSSVQTPPAPLSGRGDLPGGYFPLHEDPDSRIHRPHPFHPQNRASTVQNHALSDSDLVGDLERSSIPHISTTGPPDESSKIESNMNMPSSSMSSSAAAAAQQQQQQQYTNIPVASYFPMGYADNALPMGKYYPTNYESRKAAKKNKKKRTSPATSDAPTVPADLATAPAALQSGHVSGPVSGPTSTFLPADGPLGQPPPPQQQQPQSPHSPVVHAAVESRRRLLQYQRDMMAQASLRAYELLAGANGSGGKGGSSKNGASIPGLKGLPSSLGPSALRKPNSPRLHPLGSPGPVTPMELEAGGADGSYLDRGGAVTPGGLTDGGYEADLENHSS